MNITSKEWQIITELCDGKLPQQIADATGSSLKTIRNQIDALHHKFNVQATHQLIIAALERFSMLRPMQRHYRYIETITANGAFVTGMED